MEGYGDNLMGVLYINQRPSLHGGGPTIFVDKLTRELVRRKHSVIFDSPQNSNWALGIIESGKILNQIDRNKTKVAIRIDGIYNAEYNLKFNRAIRPDMSALHSKLASDINSVDFVVYQSKWSKDRIDDEIISRKDDNWAVINNGVDINYFKPIPKKNDGCITLISVGKMRDAYFMEALIGCYTELGRRGIGRRLILAGSMDVECQKVLARHQGDPGVIHMGSFSNDQLVNVYSKGDIFLAPRMGSSSDNVIGEALSCGLPVVVASWGGNAEMINTSCGEVAEGGHWDYNEKYHYNLAEAVCKIIPKIDEYKINARMHAEKELSVEKMVDKYLKFMVL